MKLKRFIVGILIFISITFCIQLKTFARDFIEEQYLYEKHYEESVDKLTSGGFFFIFAPDKMLVDANSSITDKEKSNNNNMIIGITIFLLIYWIGLLIFYEKESELYTTFSENDEDMFKKYNPLMAGCIADSRGVLGRDIIAVILNLVNKKIVNLEIRKSAEAKKSENGYEYLISRCKKNEHTMDDTEKYIHTWIFEDVHLESEQVDLVKRMKTISEQGNTYKNIEELGDIATDKLNRLGANKAKVPIFLKAYHIVLMAVILSIVLKHIMVNGLNIEIYYSTVLFFALILAGVFLVMPLVVLVGYLILKIFAYFRRFVNRVNERMTGQKIISTTISIVVIFGIIIVLTYLFAESKYLIFDELLIGMMFLIIRTDHLMLKNDKKILNDYYHLRYIKDKIEEYSLLDEKDVEHIVLWENYLTYSISFGNSDKISSKIKKMYMEDKMIENLQNYDFLYSISKSYLEVFWNMEFKKKKEKSFVEKLWYYDIDNGDGGFCPF